MSNDIIKATTTATPWGEPHNRRGANYAQQAIDFIQDFPLGSALDAEKFDLWAIERGHLPWPTKLEPREDGGPPDVVFDPPYANAKDHSPDLWAAHLQRRTLFRANLNKAGCHKRMGQNGHTAFFIEKVAHRSYQVIRPSEAAVKARFIQSAVSMAATQQRHISQLLQAEDLPPHEQAYVEMIYDDMEGFLAAVEVNAETLLKKIAKAQSNISKFTQLQLPSLGDEENGDEEDQTS